MEDEKDPQTPAATTGAPPTTPPGGAPAPDPTAVPYARFSGVVTERNALREAAEAARAGALEIRAQHESAVATLTAERDALIGTRDEGARRTGRLERDLLLSREHGINDEGVADYLSFTYRKHEPAEGAERPAFRDWLTKFKETDPAVLRRLGGAPGTPGPATPPKINGGDPASPAAGEATLDPGSMNMEQYKAHREKLLAENKIRVGRQY